MSHPTVGFAVVGLTNNVPVRLSSSNGELAGSQEVSQEDICSKAKA